MTMQGMPSQWSTSALGQLVQPLTTQPVLEARLERAAGCQHVQPRLVSVRARVTETSGTGEPQQGVASLPGFSSVDDAWLVRWGVGGATFAAELDVIAGGQAFAVYCDWVTLSLQNANPSPLLVQAAAVEGQVTETLRVPRRTRRATLPAVGSVDVAVPDGSSRVQLLTAIQMPTAPLVGARDSKGVTVGSFLAEPFTWLYLPGGASVLRLSNNPAGVAVDVSLLFEIPL